ncbi:MAG: hypothetical protein U0974_01825 [Gemmatimonadales bacterium]|nr:hypothetical protein [Gemmatimonadales bacterium]
MKLGSSAPPPSILALGVFRVLISPGMQVRPGVGDFLEAVRETGLTVVLNSYYSTRIDEALREIICVGWSPAWIGNCPTVMQPYEGPKFARRALRALAEFREDYNEPPIDAPNDPRQVLLLDSWWRAVAPGEGNQWIPISDYYPERGMEGRRGLDRALLALRHRLGKA